MVPEKKTHQNRDERQQNAARRRLRSSTWRAQVVVEADDAWTQLSWLRDKRSGRTDLDETTRDAYARAAENMLRQAQRIANGPAKLRGAITGAHIQAAFQYLQAAEINLLRLSPADHLRARLPDIRREAVEHLGKHDYRVVKLDELISQPQERHPQPRGTTATLVRSAGRSRKARGVGTADATVARPPSGEPLTGADDLSRFDRSLVIQTQKSVNRERHEEQSRIRSFRNVIVGVSLAITIIVVGIGFLGWFSPQTLPMCFVPDNTIVVCPAGETALASSDDTPVEVAKAERSNAGRLDIAVVALLGILGATLAAATGLRTIRGSSDPFSLPVALAFLKLPSGAFTAVLGLLLIRAGFVPGLSALDSSAQIVAYSILLGYSQQLFTTFVDRQARSVLAEAGTTTTQTAPVSSR